MGKGNRALTVLQRRITCTLVECHAGPVMLRYGHVGPCVTDAMYVLLVGVDVRVIASLHC